MLKRITSLLLLATLFLFWNETASAVTFEFEPITEPEKSWTITFNDEVNQLADLESIYITSADQVKHDVSIRLSADSKKIIVKPTKPYQFGKNYTLVIPKGFESAKGQKLKDEVALPFRLQGTHIQTISANWNSMVTNVIVQGTDAVAKVTVSFRNVPKKTLHRQLNNTFSHGVGGLVTGDLLTIHAYDAQNQLLETQHYEVK